MNRRFRRLGLALLAVAVLTIALLAGFGVVGPTRWPDGAIFVPRDVDTIQEALARASPGSTIVLLDRDGAFRGPVTIDVANIALVSANRRVRLEAGGSDPALTVRADGVVVRGLEIAADSVGMRIVSAQCRVEDVLVLGAPIAVQVHGARGCTLDGVELRDARVGIELISSGGNAFTDLVVRGATETGLKAIGSWDNALLRAVISDASVGISFEQGSSRNEVRSCRIVRAAIVGVEFRGSSDNLVVESTVDGAGTGVSLEGSTGNEIAGCAIEDVAVAGLALEQAVQNRATGNAIRTSQGDGISLSQSAENALSYNRIDRCAVAGIRLVGSDRNLLLGNTLTSNGTGILSDRSSRGRILRNEIASSDRSSIGLLFTGGEENRFFDNEVHGGETGLLIGESEGSVLLRNQIEGQVAACVSLRGSPATHLAENRFVRALVGVAVLGSGRTELLNNLVRENDIGVALTRAGSGVRIEGNTFRGNRVGLLQTDAPRAPGGEPVFDEGADVASPVVANNLFARSTEFDVLNETSFPIYVAGNWWGTATDARDPSAARISDHVDLEGSAWRGTLAVGTEAGGSQELLGRILQATLTEAGFRVLDLVGMGDSDRVREALRSQDVDFIWWGTAGGGLSETAIDVLSIPATRHWVVVVSAQAVELLPEPTVSAFAALARASERRYRYAAPREFGEAMSASFEETYGLGEAVGPVSWADTLAEAEALLKFGAVDAAIVDNLEETLTFSGFVALEDDRGAFLPVEILVAARAGLLTRFPEIEGTLIDLAGRLTTSVIHDLISRVRLLQRQPRAVAREFLVQQGLLAE